MWEKQMWLNLLYGILLGLVIAYLITLAGVLGLAFGLFQWDASERVIDIGILAVYILSCLVGGMVAGKKMDRRKFLGGLLLGAVYFVLLVIFSAAGSKHFSAGVVELIFPGILCLFSGMLGGMLV